MQTWSEWKYFLSNSDKLFGSANYEHTNNSESNDNCIGRAHARHRNSHDKTSLFSSLRNNVFFSFSFQENNCISVTRKNQMRRKQITEPPQTNSESIADNITPIIFCAQRVAYTKKKNHRRPYEESVVRSICCIALDAGIASRYCVLRTYK